MFLRRIYFALQAFTFDRFFLCHTCIISIITTAHTLISKHWIGVIVDMLWVVYVLCKSCVWAVYWPCKGCAWAVYGLSMGVVWAVYWPCTGCVWPVYGPYTGVVWSVNGLRAK